MRIRIIITFFCIKQQNKSTKIIPILSFFTKKLSFASTFSSEQDNITLAKNITFLLNLMYDRIWFDFSL